jgi:hypothetical protein
LESPPRDCHWLRQSPLYFPSPECLCLESLALEPPLLWCPALKGFQAQCPHLQCLRAT